MEQQLIFHLTGTRPLLLHNGRLANPLDPWTRRVAAISKKRQKTESDYAELAALEARGGMYETAEGHVGLPATNLRRALYDSGKTYKLGELIRQALLEGPEIVPLLIGGAPQSCDAFLAGADERLLYVSVSVNRRRTMRARAMVPAGWEADVPLLLLSDVLQLERLKPVIERAGRLGGLCDWRPKYGTFEASITVR